MTRIKDNTNRWRQAPALVISLVALFAALSGAALALPGTQTVNSGDVKNESLKSIDLKNNKAVASSDVIDESLTSTDLRDNSLTGEDVAESTLAQVPNAATLDGKAPSAFTSSNVYKKESPVAAGTTIGDGTQVAAEACDPGDVLLSGGPANINATTTLLESFPSPGTTNSWSVRVNKNGHADNFSVVILCADQ
jgi:hypothetical protein